MNEANDKPAASFERRVPEGDSLSRLVCRDCGFIQYENPKIVVGAVCRWEEKLLLCRRAINPRKGYWTLPAGFIPLVRWSAAAAPGDPWTRESPMAPAPTPLMR